MKSEPNNVAFIHEDASAGRSLVQLAESSGIKANLYRSIDAFLRDADAEEIECMVLDDSLSPEIGDDFLVALDQPKPGSFPLIVLSTSDEDPARERARAMGAVGFFREPVDGEALLDAIRWAIEEAADSRR